MSQGPLLDNYGYKDNKTRITTDDVEDMRPLVSHMKEYASDQSRTLAANLGAAVQILETIRFI